MPQTYGPEAKREAFGLYCSGLSLEQVVEAMRQKGYARYSVETLRRWALDGEWEKDRAKRATEEARLGLALDAERVIADMLMGYQNLRQQLKTKLDEAQIDFVKGVELLVKMDNLVRALLAGRKGEGQGQEPPKSVAEVAREAYGIGIDG